MTDYNTTGGYARVTLYISAQDQPSFATTIRADAVTVFVNQMASIRGDEPAAFRKLATMLMAAADKLEQGTAGAS